MTATPTQLRAAWDALQGELQSKLLATKVNAVAGARSCRAIQADIPGLELKITPEEWDATAWACQRLVDGLLTMEPPTIPVDDALGQDAIPMPGGE